MKKQKKIELLDHGYVQLVDRWGSEEAIIEAARMSTDKGFLGWGPRHGEACELYETDEPKADPDESCCTSLPGDEKLLSFLYRNKHATPFEMAGLTIETQAPIFVFREWHRHRIPFGYNELSARYTPMPDVNYVPSFERCILGRNPTTNKQAGAIKDAVELTDEAALMWRTTVEEFYQSAERLYQRGLHAGLPKELARIVVPVGRYSRMRATGNLRGWLAFMTLRTASGAQWEIRQYAETVGELVKQQFPRTYDLWLEGQA